MKEVKSPKKPLLYYYGIVLLIIFAFNLLVAPMLTQSQVTEVDYGTFMDMIDQGDIGIVQVEDSQIVFTDKDETKVYTTGPMEDPTLTERLHDCGAKFDRVIEEPASPLLSFLLTFILPILIFVGLGQSRQKYLYLPEPQNDFIFAVVCEELGMVGALVIIVLFAMLIWRGVYISVHAKDKFGMLLGLGITFQVGLQTVLNICVVTNTIPNTGISLPFFSYGGTALLMLLGEMGVLLNISRSANVEKT